MDENLCTHASQIVEVFSVSIHTNSSDDKELSFEVYGEVFAIDGDNEMHTLFRREIEDPEHIQQGGTLSLTGPNDYAIPTPLTIIGVDLWDRSQEVPIAKGVFYAEDYNHTSQSRGSGAREEQVYCKHVDGVCGYASVNYITMSFAVMANVTVKITTEDEHVIKRAPIDVYGSITARYDKSYGLISSSIDRCQEKYLCTTLLHTPKPQIKGKKKKEKVVGDQQIQLQRSVVTVPAYASLMVELDLSDCASDKKIVDKAEVKFEATHRESDVKQVAKLNIDGQNLLIQVNVRWRHMYHVMYKVEEVEGDDYSFDEESDGEDGGASLKTRTLTEIFSVFIGRDCCDPLSLFGTIRVTDKAARSFFIFKRDEDDPEILLPSNNVISIIGPPQSFLGVPLRMDVNLQDLSGQFVIHGSIVWDSENIEDPISWYGLFIRSIIRGIGGYAALSYSINELAIEASIRILFVSNESSSDVRAEIYGSVVAGYGGVEYSTQDEKEFYRNTLFMKTSNKCIEVFNGWEIPLLKSVVCVPKARSSLMIHVNLTDNVTGVGIKGAAYMQGDSSAIIRGQNYAIELFVKLRLP